MFIRCIQEIREPVRDVSVAWLRRSLWARLRSWSLRLSTLRASRSWGRRTVGSNGWRSSAERATTFSAMQPGAGPMCF